MGVIDELEGTVARVAERVGPSIVGIGSRQRGSGVVVGDGQVLTNAHNLRGDETTVTFRDGRRVTGRVAGVDIDGDLAVIAVNTTGASPIAWADAAPGIGRVVFGVSATSYGAPRVSFGLVSATGRAFRGPGGHRIMGSVEHTAPLAPGSSGGPIVDAEARFLGLDTNRLGDGFYLALPADAELRERVNALARGESPTRQRLGIAVASAQVARRLRRSVGLPEREGLLVRGVEEGSPAERAGVQEGDLIVEAAGRVLTTADDLHEALGVAGLPLELKLLRGNDERIVSITGEAAATGEA